MNILYISPMLIDYENMDGVARKLIFQKDALASIGENDRMYLASFFADDYYAVKGDDYEKELAFENKKSKQLNMFQIYPQIPGVCEELSINAVYFRVMALSWVTNKLFADLKKKNIKIVIEIPTYPFWKEKWMDAFDCIKKGTIKKGISRCGTNIVYWFYAHKLKNKIEAIVTFSNITELWGNKVIGIANGYNFGIPEQEKTLKKPSDILNLLIVASIRDNHGADRIIQGMIDYYSSGGKREICFHIVGDGDVIPKLKSLAKSNPSTANKVIFYGFKSGKQLDNIYDLADIGVSALGFHRIGVYYCSPLKSKEYFAKGLPIVGTTAEKDILDKECKEYYYSVSEDDKAINIAGLISFYDDLEAKGVTNRIIVESAARYFDWKSIMKPIYEVLRPW